MSGALEGLQRLNRKAGAERQLGLADAGEGAGGGDLGAGDDGRHVFSCDRAAQGFSWKTR
jgi:hypothetical protein